MIEVEGLGDECGIGTIRTQVLQNLVENAVKYSPYGGTITVTLTAEPQRATVTVTDEGIGIPAADLPHLWERFYRASNVDVDHISGVGIGLYVVQEIVALHGGQVGVTSVEGAGSTFTLTLPRDISAPKPTELPDDAGSARQASSPTSGEARRRDQ